MLDAHSPHLGAHLGLGGEVAGTALRCPFHGWEWAGDGRCIRIPYAKRIPSNARVGSYPTVERNGVIYFWYHAEGGEAVVRNSRAPRDVRPGVHPPLVAHRVDDPDAYMADVAGQIDRDKPIWENKLYRSSPLLCEEDGPIPRYRRWASQFYSASPDLALT